MATKTFNVAFPAELLAEVDAVAKKRFGSRSDLLREAALQIIREEKKWEYIFNEGQKVGKTDQYESEEEVARDITEQRRQRRAWTKAQRR